MHADSHSAATPGTRVYLILCLYMSVCLSLCLSAICLYAPLFVCHFPLSPSPLRISLTISHPPLPPLFLRAPFPNPVSFPLLSQCKLYCAPSLPPLSPCRVWVKPVSSSWQSRSLPGSQPVSAAITDLKSATDEPLSTLKPIRTWPEGGGDNRSGQFCSGGSDLAAFRTIIGVGGGGGTQPNVGGWALPKRYYVTPMGSFQTNIYGLARNKKKKSLDRL